MSLKISGLDNILKKLDNLSDIKTEKIVKDTAELLEKVIKENITFSDEEKKYIGECEFRKYNKSVFIDVGLKNDNVPFELWKGLWFHNWGYWNRGLNFGENGPYINMHFLWFEDAVNKVGKGVRSELKSKIKREISNAIK